MRTFIQRLSVLPFETLIGGLAIYSGVLGLLNLGTASDALTVLLSAVVVAVLNAAYTVSGLAMVAGLGLGRADVEGFGLVGLAGAVVARFIAVVQVAGLVLAVLPLTILYAMIIGACWVRLRTLKRADTLVLLGAPPRAPAENVEEDFGG